MKPIATFDPSAKQYPIHIHTNYGRETLTLKEAQMLATQIRQALVDADIERKLKEYSNECTH